MIKTLLIFIFSLLALGAEAQYARLSNVANLQLGNSGTQTAAGLALSSAFTFGSAGVAVGCRFVAPMTSNLTKFYFFVSAETGSAGNLTIQLRNYSSTTLPGATIHASETNITDAGANKWVCCTFATPYQCVQGVAYYIFVADPAGSGSNFLTVNYTGGIGPSVPSSYLYFVSSRSSDGYATGTSGSAGAPPPMVLEFADGTLMGNPYTTNANYASNTRERGIKVTGLTAPMSISGVTAATMLLVNSFKIYDGATAPGGSPILTVTPDTTAVALTSIRFTPFTLAAGASYRLVFGFSGSSVSPAYVQTQDPGAFASVDACGIGGGQMHDTIDNGAGGWTDNTGNFPRMIIQPKDTVAVTGGGASRARRGIQ